MLISQVAPKPATTVVVLQVLIVEQLPPAQL
jgi:hypothetical protein